MLKLSPGSAHDSYTKIDSPSVYKPIVYTPEGKHSSCPEEVEEAYDVFPADGERDRERDRSHDKSDSSSDVRTIQRKNVTHNV